jgi:predicted DNA-binding transcriptional regulator AlpA
MISTDEAAELAGLSPCAMYRLAHNPDFAVRAVKIGGAVRWPRARLLQYLGIDDAPATDD